MDCAWAKQTKFGRCVMFLGVLYSFRDREYEGKGSKIIMSSRLWETYSSMQHSLFCEEPPLIGLDPHPPPAILLYPVVDLPRSCSTTNELEKITACCAAGATLWASWESCWIVSGGLGRNCPIGMPLCWFRFSRTCMHAFLPIEIGRFAIKGWHSKSRWCAEFITLGAESICVGRCVT